MGYRSGLERQVADLLNGLKVNYEYEDRRIPYRLQCNYLPDFHLANGIFLEVKGRLTSEDRRKMKAVKMCNPDIDIRFVFQAPFNKIYKGSKTTYAKWCDKHYVKLWYNTIRYPEHCAIWNLPTEKLKKIHNTLHAELNKLPKSLYNFDKSWNKKFNNLSFKSPTLSNDDATKF